MNFIWDKVTEWLKGLLVGGIVSNLTGLFDSIYTQVCLFNTSDAADE